MGEDDCANYGVLIAQPAARCVGGVDQSASGDPARRAAFKGHFFLLGRERAKQKKLGRVCFLLLLLLLRIALLVCADANGNHRSL